MRRDIFVDLIADYIKVKGIQMGLSHAAQRPFLVPLGYSNYNYTAVTEVTHRQYSSGDFPSQNFPRLRFREFHVLGFLTGLQRKIDFLLDLLMTREIRTG